MLLFEGSGTNKYSGLAHIGRLPKAHTCVASTLHKFVLRQEYLLHPNSGLNGRRNLVQSAVSTLFKRYSDAMPVTVFEKRELSAHATHNRRGLEIPAAPETKK